MPDTSETETVTPPVNDTLPELITAEETHEIPVMESTEEDTPQAVLEDVETLVFSEPQLSDDEIPLTEDSGREDSESVILSESPEDYGVLLAEQDQEIFHLLDIILDLLQEPSSIPDGPEPVSQLIPEQDPVVPESSIPQPAPQTVQPPALPPVSPPVPVRPTAPPPVVSPEPSIPPPDIEPAEPVLPVPENRLVPAMPEDDRRMPLPMLPGRITPESYGIEPRAEETIFSRSVRASVGQLVEIPFRGTGWVYLGELGSRRGIVYDSRRLDIIAGHVEGQSFIFRTVTEGTYILKFYKQDFIQDYIITDYVQIIVGAAELFEPGRNVDRGRVIAEPRWPSESGFPSEAAPETQRASPESSLAQTGPVQTEPGTTAPPQIAPTQTVPPQTAEVQPAPQQGSSAADLFMAADPAEYVRRARQEFDAGNVEQALSILNLMLQRYPLGTDEALWLLGQLCEANSPARDIRLALEYYRLLVREYPQSHRVADAQRRIAYLERYFFNIR